MSTGHTIIKSAQWLLPTLRWHRTKAAELHSGCWSCWPLRGVSKVAGADKIERRFNCSDCYTSYVLEMWLEGIFYYPWHFKTFTAANIWSQELRWYLSSVLIKYIDIFFYIYLYNSRNYIFFLVYFLFSCLWKKNIFLKNTNISFSLNLTVLVLSIIFYLLSYFYMKDVSPDQLRHHF